MPIDATARDDQHTLIVTGASSGIGRELTRIAAARGYAVLAVARRGERLVELAAEITKNGGRCEPLVLDVTAADAPQRIVERAQSAFGRIDVVVNNAGAATPGFLLEQRDADIEGQWQLHVAAPLRIARAALGAVRASHGGFVFIGSGLARVPTPGYGAYCAAKAAVRAAAVQLRRELHRDGIFVTYVDPGAVATEFQAASGMEGVSPMHVPVEGVARRILHGIERRASRVNAVPWQTAATVLAEWLPSLTDIALRRIPAPVVPVAPEVPAVHVARPSEQAPPAAQASGDGFERALEAVARRMERVKLSPTFLRSALVPGATLDLHDLALRWAGMPNKNERAVLHDALVALMEAGYLESTGEETWIVLHAAE